MTDVARVFAGLFWLAIATTAGAATADRPVTLAQCPASIVTVQTLVEAIAGWTPERRKVEHRLDGMSFYDGPVSGEADLAPEESSTNGMRFEFPANTPIEFVCRYRDTDVVLSRTIAPDLHQCTITAPGTPQASVACR